MIVEQLPLQPLHRQDDYLQQLSSLLGQHGISFSSLTSQKFSADIVCFAAKQSPEPGEGTAQPAEQHPAVAKVKEYIEEHYDEPLLLETLAEVADISPFHLLRVFRESEGITPHGYILDLRIRKACDLLSDGYSIIDAALATGFYDQSHFTNTFRKITGTTPRQFQHDRKILQEKE